MAFTDNRSAVDAVRAGMEEELNKPIPVMPGGVSGPTPEEALAHAFLNMTPFATAAWIDLIAHNAKNSAEMTANITRWSLGFIGR